MPMIPNFQLDSTVRKHIEALRKSGEEGWGECGAHYLEWTEREAYVLFLLVVPPAND